MHNYMATSRDYTLHQMSNHIVLTTKLSWNCSEISEKEFGLSLCGLSAGCIFSSCYPLTCIPAVDFFKLINQAREQKALPDTWPANRKRGVTLCYLVPFYLSPWCRKWTNTLQKNNEWSWWIKVKQAWQVLKKKKENQKTPHQELPIYS